MQRVKLEGSDASDDHSRDLEEEKSKAKLNVLVTLAVFGAVVAALRVGKYKDIVSMLKFNTLLCKVKRGDFWTNFAHMSRSFALGIKVPIPKKCHYLRLPVLQNPLS